MDTETKVILIMGYLVLLTVLFGFIGYRHGHILGEGVNKAYYESLLNNRDNQIIDLLSGLKKQQSEILKLKNQVLQYNRRYGE